MKTILLTVVAVLLFNVIPAVDILNSMDEALRFHFSILAQGDVDVVLEPEDGYKPTEEELEAARTVIEYRLDIMSITERSVTIDKQNGFIRVRYVKKPDETGSDSEKIIAKLCEKSRLTFVDPEGNVILEGRHVASSVASYDSTIAQYIVFLSFNEEGKKLFANATARLVGQKITICMDDLEIISPTMEGMIPNGRAIINNQSSFEEAEALANKIAAGALPFSLVPRNHSISTAPQE